MIPSINTAGKPAKYARGHNPTKGAKGHVAWNKGKPYPAASLAHKGKKLTPEQIRQRDITRRAKHDGLYCVKKGWKHTPETIQRMTETSRKNARYGPDNHFYGRKHTPEIQAKIMAKLSAKFPNGTFYGHKHTAEARAKISARMSGPNHPNWHGGMSPLPYGPEFTRKFKRLILQRDNYTCQHCGVTQSEAKRTLQIHHIDHNKMNNDPANLMTVCGPCNMGFNSHP